MYCKYCGSLLKTGCWEKPYCPNHGCINRFEPVEDPYEEEIYKSYGEKEYEWFHWDIRE